MLKQMVWILLGAVAFFVMLVSDYHRIARLAYPAYAMILILLAVVLFEGKTSHGSAAMDSDRAICLSAVGVCEAGADSRHGALLLESASSRLAATSGDSRRVDACRDCC